MLNLKINTLQNLILKKKKFKKYNFTLTLNKLKISKFYIIFLYNFLYNYTAIKKNINMFYSSVKVNYIMLINFKNKQLKFNVLDLNLKKKFVYSVGLILKILDLYKKSNRRATGMVKHLVNFILKKYYFLEFEKLNKVFLIVKGLRKNFIKLLYFFKLIIAKFNVNLFYINPLKSFNLKKIKKHRSIKKRVYKKLIEFNKV